MIQPRTAIIGGIILLSVAGSFALAGTRVPDRAPAVPSSALSVGAAPPPAASASASGAAGGFLGVVLARVSADLAPRFEGRLRDVSVRLGDVVPAGGLIASLDVPSLRFDRSMAEAAVQAALVEKERTAVELAEAEERLARRTSLSAEALATGEELATARYQRKLAAARLDATRAQLAEKQARLEQLRQANADAEIRAPFEGIVAARYVDPGVNVTPSTPIVRLISANELFVRFAVPEDRASSLSTGAPVRVSVGGGGVALQGSIEKIAPEIDAASRMVIVEARLDLGGARPPVLSGEMARVQLAEKR